MLLTQDTDALVVVTDARAKSDALALSHSFDWPLLDQPSAIGMMRHVLRRRLKLLVMILADDTREAEALILAVRSHWAKVRVVAVSRTWSARQEAAIRIAGASLCLEPQQLIDSIDHIADRTKPARHAISQARAPDELKQANSRSPS